MAGPLSLDELSVRTGLAQDEITRVRDAGLIDPDGDHLFDAHDIARLQSVREYLNSGGALESFREHVERSGSSLLNWLFAPHSVELTTEEVAAVTGLSAEQVDALTAALGLPPDSTRAAEDLEMLKLTKEMIDAGFPFEAILEGGRVYVDTFRRLAEANMQMLHRYLCEPLARGGAGGQDIARTVAGAVGVIEPTTDALMRHLYERFMSDAIVRHAAAHLEPLDPDAPPGSMLSTIVFVDLSLFSTYTYLEGDEAAVEIVDHFDRAVRAALREYSGRVVKQIGDEFMLIFHEPVEAVRFAMALRENVGDSEEAVQIRTGIHHGSVLYRLGDYWGNAVNVAARIVSMAMPNSILVTEPVAKAALDAGIGVEDLGVRSLRGMEEPLELYRVVRAKQ